MTQENLDAVQDVQDAQVEEMAEENKTTVKFGFVLGVNSNNELFVEPIGDEKPDILQLFGLVEYFRFTINNWFKPVSRPNASEK